MNRVAITTVAGISSRFNKDIDKENKVLKCLYTPDDEKCTLLYHLIQKLSYADSIIVVGGYKFTELKNYINFVITPEIRGKIRLVYNKHFEDLSSGYSLYLGIQKAVEEYDDIKDVVFTEGDLDIDKDSFEEVIDKDSSVLTYHYEPIKAEKAVVLYVDYAGKYQYAFNSSHGLLSITSPFSAIYNSGQVWKFTDMNALITANKLFISEQMGDTNLSIIQNYLNIIPREDVSILPLQSWINCNTREDYIMIRDRWKNENA